MRRGKRTLVDDGKGSVKLKIEFPMDEEDPRDLDLATKKAGECIMTDVQRQKELFPRDGKTKAADTEA